MGEISWQDVVIKLLDRAELTAEEQSFLNRFGFHRQGAILSSDFKLASRVQISSSELQFRF